MKGDSLLFKSTILTGIVFLTLITLSYSGTIKSPSFWFFMAPVYFFFISFVYSFFLDKKTSATTTFFSLYPFLIIVKLIFTASLIILYTEFTKENPLPFWILVVVLYFIYSTLIAVSLYKSN